MKPNRTASGQFGFVPECYTKVTESQFPGSSKAGNCDWISRFMVFTSGVCWIASSWSPELASTAARELSS
ncbi:unnamed protein product [Malus baccata var. baccata]